MSRVVILCLAEELQQHLIIFILPGNAGVKMFPSHPLLLLLFCFKISIPGYKCWTFQFRCVFSQSLMMPSIFSCTFGYLCVFGEVQISNHFIFF